MRILLITNYFPPEIGGAAHLFFELAEGLLNLGHKTSVITGFPRYNISSRPKIYKSKLLLIEYKNGIRILRLWLPTFPRTSRFLRGIEHFLVAGILFFGGILSGRHDAIIVYSPPLPLGLTAYLISRIYGIPFIVNIQDLFPKEAVLLGLLKNKILIRLFEIIEKFIYKKANYITVHSPGNREHVIAHGGKPERVQVIYNWVDLKKIHPLPKENRFRQECKLNNLFVVSYVGTMGWCQDMTVIVETAELLKSYKNVIFLMVGNGPEKGNIIKLAREKGLTNIIFLPTQPWNKYPEVLAASDVSMINLNKNLTTPVVPSKLLNIMASGRPVIASLPSNSDARKIITEAGCGLYVEAGDAKGLAKSILEIYNNPRLGEEMGYRGWLYAQKYFSYEKSIGEYEKLLNKAILKRNKK